MVYGVEAALPPLDRSQEEMMGPSSPMSNLLRREAFIAAAAALKKSG
jgi:hypothetical protein